MRLAVELPPVPAIGPVSLEPWWETVRAALCAGAGTVWFTGGPAPEMPGAPAAEVPEAPAPEVPSASPQWCDAPTLAAAAARVAEGVSLGVVSGIPADRHPALLAREVTALDVVSGGRAAAALRWTAALRTAEPGRISEACRHLGEAVEVCRAVLQDRDPVFEGRYLHIAGAVNLPAPLRTGGPPIFVHVPEGVTGTVRRDDGASFLLHEAARCATAVVCSDDPGEIASWHALVEDAAARAAGGERPGAPPAIVCRTTLRATNAASAQRADDPATVRARLEAARAAGAEGVVVRLPVNRREGEALHADVGAPGRLVDGLAACFDHWRREPAASR